MIVITNVDLNNQVIQKIFTALEDKSVDIQEISLKDMQKLSFHGLEILPATYQVFRDGIEIHLNHGEFSMLYQMAKNPNRIFTKEQLYQKAWGDASYCNYNTVHNTICRLRNKLEKDPRHPVYIKTVIGAGYKFEPP